MRRSGYPYLKSAPFLLIITAVLLILVGSGILAYTAIKSMQEAKQVHSTATTWNATTANAQPSTSNTSGQPSTTPSAEATATLTAQVSGTATAQATVTAPITSNASPTVQASTTVTATPVALHNPYPPYRGTLALNDPLSNNGLGYAWDISAGQQFNDCQFALGGYEITNGTHAEEISHGCAAEKTHFTNFVYQVQLTIVKGSCGGLVWRANSKADNFYEFHVCSDGIFEVYNTFTGIFSSPFLYGPNAAIHKGLGQTNILAVVAIGSTMTIYINGQKIGTFTDPSNSSGQIGLEATELLGATTIVVFHNARVWTL
jgi:hypothetical protein